ncbi:MAG: 3-deoxy-7-phosphoheptulonate synthase, partial [Actinobacteria bacterium]|nr:3-deoxy-7-phosphoheptulonate synthase [Actinomycetota bacterium]
MLGFQTCPTNLLTVSEITWPDLPAAQQPEWPDAAALEQAQNILRALPPLVFAGECDDLTEHLGKAALGQAFVLQGGDCAETSVVKIGRIAGQYGKPRSAGLETVGGVSLPSYRGDAVNGLEFTEQSRTPDPMRLVQTYHASAATLNLVRAFTQGGYADLRQVHAWNQDFVSETTPGKRYEEMAAEIERAIAFMTACGADPEEFRRADVYSSHEALLLDYEKPLTRVDSRSGNLYDVSGHFVWVGERTRELDGAHIDFAAKIRNPIGVKLGPKSTPEIVHALLEKLNPEKIPGRLTFITRMGAANFREVLPELVQTVQATDHPVVWMCDPMRLVQTYHASAATLNLVRAFTQGG